MEDPGTKESVRRVPGGLRSRDVQVGRLVAIGSVAVPRFLKRFESVYSQLGKSAAVIATAASHHRLL